VGGALIAALARGSSGRERVLALCCIGLAGLTIPQHPRSWRDGNSHLRRAVCVTIVSCHALRNRRGPAGAFQHKPYPVFGFLIRGGRGRRRFSRYPPGSATARSGSTRHFGTDESWKVAARRQRVASPPTAWRLNSSRSYCWSPFSARSPSPAAGGQEMKTSHSKLPCSHERERVEGCPLAHARGYGRSQTLLAASSSIHRA